VAFEIETREDRTSHEEGFLPLLEERGLTRRYRSYLLLDGFERPDVDADVLIVFIFHLQLLCLRIRFMRRLDMAEIWGPKRRAPLQLHGLNSKHTQEV
jgi:hypothetical protein